MQTLHQSLVAANEALYACRKLAMTDHHRFSVELRAMALRLDEMVDDAAPEVRAA